MNSKTSLNRMILLVSLSVVIGFLGGGAAWALLKLIKILTNLAIFRTFSTQQHSIETFSPNFLLIVAAVLGALIVSLIAKWAPTIRGHGIPETIEAVLTRQSRITPRTAFAKPIASAIAIGTGAPFGAEGPIIVTGGSLGSLLGQIVRVTPSERKILLSAGAAAGMSATFGTPLAAVILAIELLLFEFSVRAFIPLVVASAVAGGMHSILFGHGPLFNIPTHDYAGLEVLPSFILLGIACGVLAILISRGLFFIESIYRRLPVSIFWHPIIGAICFSVIGMFIPRVLGVGYSSIDDVLNSRLALGTVCALAVGKLVAWWLALASGTSGGTLAPILLISASFGTIVGAGLNEILPGTNVALGAFAVVAMAATFGAATQATFTSIVFIFELTRDYNVILPLMLAAVIADLIYSSINDDSLMTEKLHRRGMKIGRHFGVDPFASTFIKNVMTTQVKTIDSNVTLDNVRVLFATGTHGAYPLVDDGKLVGIITRDDMIVDQSLDTTPLEQYVQRGVAAVSPEDTALKVIGVMMDENLDHIPVVSDDNEVIGIVTKNDLMKIRRSQLDDERIEDKKKG